VRSKREPPKSNGVGHHAIEARSVLGTVQGSPLRFARAFRRAWVTAVLKADGIKPAWKAYGWTALTPPCLAEFRRINLHWHDLRHEYASRLVEKGVPLAQVRDLLGHASITTTERYDNQKLENLQAAAARLERGETFTPPPPAMVETEAQTRDRKPRSKPRSPSNRQDFVKSWGDQHPRPTWIESQKRPLTLTMIYI